jgi:hypothetical protein
VVEAFDHPKALRHHLTIHWEISSSLHEDIMPTDTHAIAQTWEEFIVDLQKDILPIYLRHEIAFDPQGVHGRMHICRSVIFAECMARYYHRVFEAEIDFYAIRTATAMHDSGRRANGVDYWEGDSVDNCRRHVRSRCALPEESGYADYVAGLIKKDGEKDVRHRTVYDADVLEIMRPCCGHGGLAGFKPEFLHFGSAKDSLFINNPSLAPLRQALIREAWNWIVETERLKLALVESSDYMLSILRFLEQRRRSYPSLAIVLDPES